MKKLIFTLVVLLGTLAFTACGKKKDDNNSCQGYPPGYVRVTDQRMLQMVGSNGMNNYGNYNQYNQNQYNQYNNGQYNQYNQYPNQNGIVCVDQMTFNNLQQQINTGNYNYNNNNFGNTYNNGGYNNNNYNQGLPGYNNGYPTQPSYGGNSDPYCMYFPQDPYCWYHRPM